MAFRPKSYSAFTPFLRRFTDERALDLAETRKLYDEVTRSHTQSPWGGPNAIDRASDHIAGRVGDLVDVPDDFPLIVPIDRCQRQILVLETTIFSSAKINWDIAQLSLKEQVDLRHFLHAQQHFLANDDRVGEMLATAVGNITGGLIQELQSLPPPSDRATFSVPLINMVPDPNGMVDRIVGTVCDNALAEVGLFTTLQNQLYRNVCVASGVEPYDERGKRLIPPAESDLSPVELVEAYCKDTPFHDLLLAPLPFSIPDEIRFEHMHVVAGTGHGKTQTLQHLIMHDLARPPEEVPGLVIIDSQGDILAKIAKLSVFEPGQGALADRLIIIDPTDIDYPPALGLFDVNLARLRGYDKRDREQIMNGVIELYDYIFGGLLGAELTQKQNVIFRYLARLMLAIPNATILTLKDVMQDSAPFAHHFESLTGTARDFFLYEFSDRQFNDTKKQILRRLWGILENPTFERLFSNPRNKVDMFDALNSGKIVLVNTAKDFLKAERSSILGRFFIALTFQAALERAAIPEHKRRAAFLYIDEAADYFDGTIDSLLTQARKFKLGVVLAHQYLEQLRMKSRALEASIMANTSIKLAGGVSSADAHALAPNMGTTHQFISGIRKRGSETDFAAYVRNLTPGAVTLTVPFGTLEAAPRMPGTAVTQLIAANRTRFSASLTLPPPVTPEHEQPRPVATASDKPPPQSSATPEVPAAQPTDADWRS